MAQAILEEPKQAKKMRRMSWEEFLQWEPEHNHNEWVDGEVIELMPVEQRHQTILSMLDTLISLFALKFDLGSAFIAPFLMRLISRPSGREPDLLFIRKENLHRLRNTFVDGPADLVIEIISPESDARDRITKFAEYELGGVREYWLIDHFEQETFFYQLDAQGKYQRVLANESGRYDCAAIPGFWINVNWLWQEPKPTFEAMRALNIIPAV